MPSVERLRRREHEADVQALAPDPPGRGIARRHRALDARDVRTEAGGSLRGRLDSTLRRHGRRHGDIAGMQAVDRFGAAGGSALRSIRPALRRIRRPSGPRDHRGFLALPIRSAEKARRTPRGRFALSSRFQGSRTVTLRASAERRDSRHPRRPHRDRVPVHVIRTGPTGSATNQPSPATDDPGTSLDPCSGGWHRALIR